MDTDRAAPTTGRPRDPEVERCIIVATQDLLVENGYAGTTIAAVAARAHCSKAAIYRRWRTKADLVVAAVQVLHTTAELPDTGMLRDDLLAAALHFARADVRSARVLASLLSEIGRDSELYEVAYRSIGRPPVDALIAVIQRWIAKGAIRPDAPVSLIAGVVPTAAFGSVALRQRPLDPEAVTELVDFILLPALTASSPSAKTEKAASDP